MTARQAKKLKYGDKVAYKLYSSQVSAGEYPNVRTVDHVELDPYSLKDSFIIFCTDGVSIPHRLVRIVSDT